MTHAHHDTHTSEGERLDQASPALATPTDHGTHADHHGGHMGHGGQGGHGDHAAQFRDRFWWSLLLALPVVGFSSMFADLLGYTLPAGTGWISPVLGTVVFVYGGWPFLTGAVSELRSRQPGMMLLVAMAITVAFVASALTSLGVGGFDLDFWWELALLVVIMLLGHWLEMRALGQASSALDALAALLPDQADRVRPTARSRPSASTSSPPGRRAGALRRPGPGDGIVTDGEAEVDESMITGESRPVPKTAGRPGRGRHRGHRLGAAGPGRRRRRGHGPGRHPPARRTGPGLSVPGAGTRRPGGGAAVLLRQHRRTDHLRHLAGARRARPTPSSGPSPCWSSPAHTPSVWPSRW